MNIEPVNSQKTILGQKFVASASIIAMQKKKINIIKPAPNLIFFINEFLIQ
jgi:hypothetical protein